MKKIISLLLVLSLAVGCMFVLGSCGEEEKPDDTNNNQNNDNNQNDDNTGNDNTGDDNNQGDDNANDGPTAEELLAEALEPFVLAIAKTEPTSATVTTEIENDLLGVPMTGIWDITYNDDGSASVIYSYMHMIEDLASTTSDLPYEIKTGECAIDAEGNVIGTDLAFTKVAAAALVKYNLDASKLSDVSTDAGVLSAKVAAADTAAVLGADLGADANFTMTVVEGVVVAVTVTYEIDGVSAKIISAFN